MLRNLLPVLLSAFCLPVFAQVKEKNLQKLSPVLQSILVANKSTDSITVSIASIKHLTFNHALHLVASSPFFVFVTKISTSELTTLVQDSNVIFINPINAPKEEVNTGASDPTLNLITYAQHQFSQVKGDSIFTSVKERLLDTTDIDLKGRVFLTGLENNTITVHASLMATIIAGAANSSPLARGAAPGAYVSSSSFNNLFPDADSVFRKYKISEQNHSYGTIVENFYGNEAVAYDQTALNNPTLLHVFSAGNSGDATNATGSYAGINNLANLTGNFKQAKNIITVSAVDSAGQLLLLSSKGPAYDGRIKPELVAYGEDGSSGAAALSSGAAIMVQDMYKQLHAGLIPSSSLVKVILLNSADDAGEKYPDYSSGYGNLNAYKALQTVRDNRYFENNVAQNEVKTFSIAVPANASQVKLTLVWNDLPAIPNATKALVNDLDFVLKSSTNQSWLPWVLNSKPVRDSLLLPAQRKVDTLNNVEQISVDNPLAGTYTIEVKGSRVVSPNQSFAIAYQIDTTNTFYWTYPTSSDQLIAGKTQTLRWQTNIIGSGRIDYATNNNNWRTIGIVSDLAKNLLKWVVPDTVTNARLRLVTSFAMFVSDTFAISPQQTLQAGFNCVDSFLLYWNALPVNRYRLYELGTKYLQPFATISNTSLLLFKSQHPSIFYSVAPLINGKEGIRSNTVNYTSQGVGCYLRSFFLQTQTATTATFTAQLGSLYNVAEVSFEKFAIAGITVLQTITNPQTTMFSFIDSFLHPGENRYRLKIKLASGLIVYSSVETVYAADETKPVIFYPNPASQNSYLNVIVKEVGRYTIQFFDATGRLVKQQLLNSSVTLIPANLFSKGMYLVRTIDKEEKPSSQKLIIY